MDLLGTGASLLQMRSLGHVLQLAETEADIVRLSRSAQIEKVREALERTRRTQEGRGALQTALQTFEHSRFQLRPPTFRISHVADAALRWVRASASRRISAAITGILVETSELGSILRINLVLRPDQN